MNKKTTSRNLIIFCIVALVIGWLGVGVDHFLPEQEEGESLGMAVWLVVPLLLVIMLRTFMGGGWKDAGLWPNWQGNLKWYGVAILIFPWVTGMTLALGKVTGWMDFSGFQLESFLMVFLSLLGINVLKNVFEESVWRGYLTVKLVRLQIRDWQIYLVVGLVWGLWHIPYYLFFLSGETVQAVLPVSRIAFSLLAVVNMIAWTVMFTELYRLTQSIWPVILMHAVEDSLINHLVIEGFAQISSGMHSFISPICGLIPTLLYLLIGLGLRQKRIIPKGKGESAINQKKAYTGAVNHYYKH